jgi:hypothetical protein
MEDWSPEPAGRHGRVLPEGRKLMYNGRELKMWGINHGFSSCSPDKAIAERRAAFYRKYGINAVRLHKYAQDYGRGGIQARDSFAKLDPEALDRMDYFIAKLKESGIYTKLSPTFGVAFGPEEYKRVPYLDEMPAPRNNRVRTKHGTVWLSREKSRTSRSSRRSVCSTIPTRIRACATRTIRRSSAWKCTMKMLSPSCPVRGQPLKVKFTPLGVNLTFKG